MEIDTLDKVFEQVLDENNAQEVFKRLEDLDNQRLKIESRWIWELIQNARGTVGSQAHLQIEVALNGDCLTFRHNGASFREREIAHLILHGSTKQDPKDIGRFGTGFITTHLISRRVRIRGCLVNGSRFDFVLDRTGGNAIALQSEMKASREEFKSSLGSPSALVPSPFTTEYSYVVTDSVRPVVVSGLGALKMAAAYIFAFNPMLDHLTIVTDHESVQMTAEPLDNLSANVCRLGIRENGRTVSRWVVKGMQRDAMAALVVDLAEPNHSVRLPNGIPKIFVAFPLNGTEEFCLPLVLNSELFVPREDRDGIHLGVGTNEANKSNQELFVLGCRHIVELVTLAAEQNWLNVPELVCLRGFDLPQWADKNWLRNQIRMVLIEGLRTERLLRTISNNLISPKAAWIPISCGPASSLDLWAASEPLLDASDLLPCSADQEPWAAAAQSWIPFCEANDPVVNGLWTIDRLADHLSNLRNFNGIIDHLHAGRPAIAWVNEVHALICKAGRYELFSSKPLVPNQCGDLAFLGKLNRDVGIDDVLKEIGELVGLHLRAELIHSDITTRKIIDSLKIRTEEDVVTQIISTIHQGFQRGNPVESFRIANVKMFSWLLCKGKMPKLDGFPVMTAGDSNEKLERVIFRPRTAPADRPLAPILLWPQNAQVFADLLPEAVILNECYLRSCENPIYWQNLAEAGFLHVSPIYEDDSFVDQFLPDEPLRDEEEKVKPRSEKMCRRTEIAWLIKTDRSIVDRARSSPARAIRLIQFCIEFLLSSDERAFEVQTIRCDNGSDHRYYRANWLGPLRNRRWIPVENEKRNVPTAENLANLLVKEHILLQRLGEERVSKFFQILGVSPADLVLRTLGHDDLERMSLVQSLALITAATGNDALKVQVLAGAIKTDPAVLTVIQERQDQIRRVARNQELGALVEKLFVEALRDTGLVVTRTGTGHDYSVAASVSDQEDNVRIEIVGAGNPVLVEVKATTGNCVRMSAVQVQAAVLNMNRFFLCAVATDDTTLDADNFRKRVRFVPDIGWRLQKLWAEYCSLKVNMGFFGKTDDGLTAEVVGNQVRFRVDEEVWIGGIDFDAAINLIKSSPSEQ